MLTGRPIVFCQPKLSIFGEILCYNLNINIITYFKMSLYNRRILEIIITLFVLYRLCYYVLATVLLPK
jgi:hypothetical protein